ncbi:MAG: hypothetical protein HN344_00350, partial [Gammaproteobacteria bacterium]|nr:hypothetical protein [Gammaproteobacteria bacterium]
MKKTTATNTKTTTTEQQSQKAQVVANKTQHNTVQAQQEAPLTAEETQVANSQQKAEDLLKKKKEQEDPTQTANSEAASSEEGAAAQSAAAGAEATEATPMAATEADHAMEMLGEAAPTAQQEFSLGNILSAVGLGGGAIAVGGGSAAVTASTAVATATAATTTLSSTVSGSLVFGPVEGGHGLSVEIYAADGATLLGNGIVDANGNYSIDIGNYSGAIIAKVIDASDAPDFIDEATNQAKDLNAEIMAVGVVGEGDNALNVNPLTTVAAQSAGVSYSETTALDEQAIAAANSEVASTFGLQDLHNTDVVATNSPNYATTTNEQAKTYGQILEQMSVLDAANGGDMQATIDALTTTITQAAESSTQTTTTADTNDTATVSTTTVSGNFTAGQVIAGTTYTVAEATAEGTAFTTGDNIEDTILNISAVALDPGSILSQAEQVGATGTSATMQVYLIELMSAHKSKIFYQEIQGSSSDLLTLGLSVLNKADAVVASGSYTADAAGTLAALTKPVTYSLRDTLTNLTNASYSTAVSEAAQIESTSNMNVNSLSALETLNPTATITYPLIKDTATNLATLSNAQVAGATNGFEATTVASASEVTTLGGFISALPANATKKFSVEDGANALLAPGESGHLDYAESISVTGSASKEQIEAIEGYGSGEKSYTNISDSAANIIALGNTILNKATGTVAITDTTVTAQNGSSLAALTKAVQFSVADSATDILNVGTALSEAQAISVEGTISADQLKLLEIINSNNSYAAVEDTATEIVGLNGGADTMLDKVAGTVTVTTAATAAQAATLADLTHAVVFNVEAPVAGLVGDDAEITSTQLAEAADITVTDAVNLTQAAVIEAFDNEGSNSYAISDTVADIAAANEAALTPAATVTATGNANATQATTLAGFTKAVTFSVEDGGSEILVAGSVVMNEAVDITVTGNISVDNATTIDDWTNSGTNSYAISDDADQIAASNDGVLGKATAITAQTAATVSEAATIAGFTTDVTFDVEGAAADLASASATAMAEARHITATDNVTVALAQKMDTWVNSGNDVYAISDTAAILALGSSAAAVGNASGVEVSDAVTVAQLTAINTAATNTVTYGKIVDSSSNLLTDIATNGGVGTYVVGSHAVTVNDATNSSIAATDLSTIGAATAGTVTVTNAVAISGTQSEVTAALVTSDSKVVAETSVVTLSDSSIAAASVNAIDTHTSGLITVNATTITGDHADITTA